MKCTLNIPLHIREGIHDSENNYQRVDERREVALSMLEQPDAKHRLAHVSFRVGDRTLHDTLLIVECPHEPLVIDIIKLCIALRQPYLTIRLDDDGTIRAIGPGANGKVVKPEEVISY